MRAVIQRVASASAAVDGETTGAIGAGLLILLGIHAADTAGDGDWLAHKIAALRIFEDESGKMNRSVVDIAGGVLVVSQFTLFGSTRKGTRPSFNEAARPELAIPLYEDFIRRIAGLIQRPVATGRFGATMQVALINDGPVTLTIDTQQKE